MNVACFEAWFSGKVYGGSKPILLFKRLGTLTRWFYATEKSVERTDFLKFALDG